MTRRGVIALACGLVFANAAMFGFLFLSQGTQALPEAGVLTEAYLSAPFTLTNQNGEVVTRDAFNGRPTAWFFGFTACPDVCPTALAELSARLVALGPDASKLNVVFVSVDPERDTPEVLRNYLSAFDARIVGLTGTRSDIDAMAAAYFARQEKVPLEDGTYTMDHTAVVMLAAADGAFRGTLDPHEDAEVQLTKLRRLVSSGPGV